MLWWRNGRLSVTCIVTSCRRRQHYSLKGIYNSSRFRLCGAGRGLFFSAPLNDRPLRLVCGTLSDRLLPRQCIMIVQKPYSSTKRREWLPLQAQTTATCGTELASALRPRLRVSSSRTWIWPALSTVIISMKTQHLRTHKIRTKLLIRITQSVAQVSPSSAERLNVRSGVHTYKHKRELLCA